MKILNKIFIGLLQAIRPLLGPAECKYPLSCTQFAIQELRSKPLLRALWRCTKRVLSCNPFNKNLLEE